MMNVLVVSLCNEKLHELEFVNPITQILLENDVSFFKKSSLEITKKDLEGCSHVILSGTSLKDNVFLESKEKFLWLVNFSKPVLGICAGMQILGSIYGQKICPGTEIGFFEEKFTKSFLGLKGKKEVWHLHNSFVEFDSSWEVFCDSKDIVQAVKLKEKDFYGCLFHPEVRHKDVFLEFLKK
jgi:GMP synthase-like glutamine amidotransferase